MTTKKQYKEDKKVREMYRNNQAQLGESYSDFKRRVKKQLGC